MAIEITEHPETNPDPITGAPGAHPVGVGLGAAAGGIAAGAAAGTFAAGPIGTVVGAGIGAVVGGLAGKGAAESMNPTQDPAAYPESDLRLGTGGRTDDRTVAVAGVAAVDSAEDAYWRAKYRDEPYYSSSRSYDDYAPAYRLAHQRSVQSGGSYDASEEQLAREWERAKGVSRLTWPEAKRATQAAWNRLESLSTGTDPLPLSRVDERRSPLNPPSLSHGNFQGLTRDALASVADPMSTSTGHLSDAAHEAWEQTRDRVAAAGDGTYAATSDRPRFEAMRTVREAVKSRPLAAIGIAMAVGFVLVGGPSLSRAISRARWY